MSDVSTDLPNAGAARNPAKLALIGVGVLAALAALWVFVVSPLLADEPAATNAPTSSQTGERATTVAQVPDGAETAGALPLVTYEVFLERDPFSPVTPLFVAQGSDSGSGGSGNQNNDSTDIQPIGGTGNQQTNGTCTSGREAVCDGRIVSVIDVRSASGGGLLAIIQVDSTIYEVREGDIFATDFQVVRIREDRVSLLRGDDAFDLSVGARVLK